MASTKRQVNKGTSDPSARLADVAVYVDGGGNDVAASVRSTGVYTYDFTPTQTGVHSYAMQGTSGLIAADGGEFTVYPLEA